MLFFKLPSLFKYLFPLINTLDDDDKDNVII